MNAQIDARLKDLKARVYDFSDRMKLLPILTEEFRAAKMDGMVELLVMCEQVFRAQATDMRREADRLLRDAGDNLNRQFGYVIIETQWDDPEFD